MTDRPDLPTMYERLGGEPAVRALVDRFYDLMDTLPEVAVLRAMHPDDLASSRDKLHWFLVGYTGGPPLYHQKIGHPMLRARHMPFAIDDAARDQWMLCMDRALAETALDDELRGLLSRALRRVADHMRNQAPA